MPNEGSNSHVIKVKQIVKALTLWSFSKLRAHIYGAYNDNSEHNKSPSLKQRKKKKNGRKEFFAVSCFAKGKVTVQSHAEGCSGGGVVIIEIGTCVQTPARVVLHLYSLVSKTLWYLTTS